MKSLKVSKHLFTGFGIILVLMTLLLSIALMHYGQINAINTRLIENEMVQSEAAHNLNTENRKSGLMLLELLIAKEKLQTEAILPRMEHMQTMLSQAFRTLDTTAISSTDKNLLANIAMASTTYMNSFERARALIAAGHKDEAANLINYQTLPLLDAVQEPILTLMDREQKHISDSTQEVRENIANARMLTLITGMAALCAALAVALFVSHRIERQDNATTAPAPEHDAATGAGIEARMVIAAAASKAKASAPPRNQTPSAGIVAGAATTGTAFSASRIDFTLERKIATPAPRPAEREVIDIIGEVRVRPDAMSLVAGAITRLQKPLTGGNQQQAAAAQQAQPGDAVKKNARLNPVAPSAGNHAHKGGQVVAQVIDTMTLINACSNQIAGMINVIDGTAGQTNILAFNAEAEALLASEQGRNFGVVAAEVRKLAKRSSRAAREIKGLIADSAQQSQAGAKLIDQAGETMHDIVINVKHVTSLIQSITQQGAAQSSELPPIAPMDQPLDDNRWQNAALVGQMSVAAQGMQQKAEQLAHAVSLFKLGKIGSSELKPVGAEIVDLTAMRKRTLAHRRALVVGGN